MPTELTARSVLRLKYRRTSALIEALGSDELAVVLLWTVTGLAVTVGLTALGLQTDAAQSLVMFG